MTQHTLRRVTTALVWSVVTVIGTLALQPVAAGATTLASDSSPDAPPSSANTTWAIQPATEEGADGRVSLRHTIAPGESGSDFVVVTNFSPRPTTFAIYAGDGTIGAEGNFDLAPGAETASGGGSWIDLTAPDGAVPRDGGGFLVEVPSESAVVVPVEITVPEHATPGDHPAGIVAEYVPDAGSSVQLASRVGVRVHLRVSGDIAPTLAIENLQTDYTASWNPFAPGTVTITYTVSNAGNVRLGADTTTALAGPFGMLPLAAGDELREILPASGATKTVTLDAWPLFVTSGDVSTLPSVVGDDVVEAALHEARASFTVWTIPWSQLVVLAALVAGFFVWRRTRRRSKERIQERIDAAVAEATAAASAD